MAVHTTYYTRNRTKIERLSAKGLSVKWLILVSLLAIGRSTPLLGQDAEQEMVEQEMPDQSSDQEEAEQEDTAQDSTQQESEDSLEQDGLSRSNALEGEQGSPDQDTQEQKTEPEAKSAAASAGSAVAPVETQGSVQKVLPTSTGMQAVSAQDKAQDNKTPEKPAATPKVTQEIPALVLEEKPAQASKPALSPQHGSERMPGLIAPVRTTTSIVTQPGVKPAARPEQKAVAQERAAQVIPEDEDIVGIDTVNLDDPQGNWLFKRIWWERAEKKIEKIRRLVNAVFESRVIFLAQRTDIDRNVLDPFYVAIGLGQGELQRILDELIGRLEKEREKEGALSDQERGILQELRKEESALKQMKTDVANVARIDHDIDEALNTLFEQINKVREYEGDAWDNFKEIARVLNDIKARELYYTMDIIAKNIEDVQAYIQQDYTRHFNQLSSAAKQQVERLRKSIEAMREKGLDLGKQLELLEQQEKMRASGQQPEDEDEEETEAEQGFFSSYIMAPIYYVGSSLTALFDGIVSVVAWPINYVTGTTSDVDQEVKEEDED